MGAEGITPKALDIELHDRVPDGQWEIVDVIFPSTAGTDFQIPHSLSPYSPEEIEYTVLRQATPGTVYEDRSATRTPWSPGFIVLRSDTASWTGRLLLRVLKTGQIWRPGQSIVYTPPVGVVYPIALNKGGTAADLSATGPGYLKQASAGAAITVASSIAAGDIGSGQLALARGGTNADLSATGGAGKVLKQKTSGGNIAVETLTAAELGSCTGSSANFLRGDLGWYEPHADFPYCDLYKSGDDSAFTRASDVTVGFNSELYDAYGMHDNSTNNSRITIPTGQGGVYYVKAAIKTYDGTAWGGSSQYVYIRQDGTTPLLVWTDYRGNVTQWWIVSGIFTLSAGAYIETLIREDGGPNPGTRIVKGTTAGSRFMAVRIK